MKDEALVGNDPVNFIRTLIVALQNGWQIVPGSLTSSKDDDYFEIKVERN